MGAVLFAATVLAALTDPVLAQQADLGKPPKEAGKSPVKVFILAGQSNMEGQGVADLDGKDYNEGRGTLNYVMKDPAKAPLYKHLKDDRGQWTVRDDVWVWYKPEDGPVKSGPLSLGFTPYGGQHHFGPELQFGHVIGNHLANQVLLIKTAWGGKSLYKDFRPPASAGEVGPYYTKMIEQVREVLANLKKYFPGYDGGGYELAGFVWYHGWNDGCDPKSAVPEYETNLVNLVKDVRKDLKAPNLPVVIGELTGPWITATGEWAAIRKAQADAAAQPEFKGTVAFVETHDFVRKPEESPNPGHGHHEFGNAETYFLVGNALGEGMKKLLRAACTDEKPEPAKPQSRTVRNVEGWIVRVDERLLVPPNEELGLRALKLLEAKLADIKYVMAEEPLAKLQTVPIVLDLTHGKLHVMQYHPDADWLEANGYSTDLVKCVHIPEAADLPTPRNINEQPWVVLHELAHAYHDQVLGFDEPRIREAYERFKRSGRGDSVLLYDGRRVRHYALADHKEFFAEMTEAYFGMDDFFPFNRAELMTAEPEIFTLLRTIWEPVHAAGAAVNPKSANDTGKENPVPSSSDAAVTILWYAQPAEKWVEPLPLDNALACSRYHNLLHRYADLVEIANRSNLTNSFCSGILQTDNARLYKTPTYYAQQLYACHAKTRPLQVEIEGDLERNDVSATLSRDGRTVVLFVVNNTRGERQITLDLSAFAPLEKTGQIWTLLATRGAGERDVTNSFDDPERVRPVASSLSVRSVQFDYIFPALSLTVLKFRAEL